MTRYCQSLATGPPGEICINESLGPHSRQSHLSLCIEQVVRYANLRVDSVSALSKYSARPLSLESVISIVCSAGWLQAITQHQNFLSLCVESVSRLSMLCKLGSTYNIASEKI